MGAEDERLQFERKRQISDMVKRRFARYGDEVLATVFTCALQPALMGKMLKKLEIYGGGTDLEYQLDEIQSFIATQGAFEFAKRLEVKKVERKLTADQRRDERMKKIADSIKEVEPEAIPGAEPDPRLKRVKEFHVNVDLDRIPDPTPISTEPAAPPPRRPATNSAPAAKREAAALAEVPPSPPAAAPTPASPAAAPEPGPPPPRTDLPWIEVPGYKGPERRVLAERRHKPDRRKNSQAIMQNQRYGGDRRKSAKGRRESDRSRPDRWWNYLGEPDQDLLIPFLKNLVAEADKKKG